MIHPLAQVATTNIGPNTRVWQYAIILEGAQIGDFCNINCHTFIENKVILGDYITVKSGVYLWDGLIVEDHVFIGPNATFANNRYPRSNVYPPSYPATRLGKNATIGAGAIILDGIQIGPFALIAAGSVVTRNVPAHALVKGNPGRISGWVGEDGAPLKETGDYWVDEKNNRYALNGTTLQKLSA